MNEQCSLENYSKGILSPLYTNPGSSNSGCKGPCTTHQESFNVLHQVSLLLEVVRITATTL